MSAPDLTLGDLIRANAQRFPDGAAYIADGAELTHGRLLARASALAVALAENGVRRQDRIAVLGRNSIAFGEVLTAGWLSGIVVATVNFRLAAPEIARILVDADPCIVFCDAEYLPLVDKLRGSLPGVKTVVTFGTTTQPDVTAYSDMIASSGRADLPFLAQPDDIACLIYTSGTTGRPKGAMLGQREMRVLAQSMNGEMRTGSTDRALLVMPQFHIGAIAIGLGVHARGGTAVLQRQFEPAAVLDAVAADAITVLHLAPVMLQALLDAASVRPGALAAVRTVVYSAAPMTAGTLATALAAMPAAGFLNLYGQTEVSTSGLPRELHRTSGSEADRRRLSSVGHPFPDTEVRILDDEGREVPTDSPGEIVVRTGAMFRGYWNDSAATAATIRDGWCYTGDIGRVDAEGLLYLVDRKKDVVISGGENVYCPEVEDAMLTHPAVVACAVIGVPDDRWGEAVCAVVVTGPDARVTLEELRAHTRTTIAGYKAPRRMEVVDALPVLVTGKIDKKELRARYARPRRAE